MIRRQTQCVFVMVIVLLLACPALTISADTIDDLVLLEDVLLCKKCHEQHGIQWPKSPHAGSFSGKNVLQGFREFIVSTQREASSEAIQELNKECFSCHAPQTRNASEKLLRELAAFIMSAVDDKDSPEGISALTELKKISVDCGVCHLIYGMPEGQVEPDTIYGPGWDENEISHKKEHGFATVGSAYLMSSGMCTRCHKEWPAGTPSIVLSFHNNSEDHFSMADENNKTCQQCHMMDGERIIHNMPKYAGSIGFSAQKTADLIGAGLAAVTVFAMLVHMLARAVTGGGKRQKKKGLLIYGSAGCGAKEIPEATAFEEESFSGKPDPGTVPGGDCHGQ